MHYLPSDQNDLKYLLDIDLAILGTLPERFSEYERQIRQEYIWVPSAIYAIKRSEVLSKFKHQTPIYQTKFFQKMLESRAYLNLSQD